MTRRGGGVALVSVALSSPAFAENAKVEHRVDFRADRVELSPDDAELSLSGDVVVRSERFQLTGDEVTLTRSARGIHVEGAGRLAFCRCKQPPIALGFAAADLAPPTDVLLEHATVRVFGVPLFYSPILWLRSRERAGILPPSFAYRGEEGVLLGSGVHVPLGAGAAGPAILDVGFGAYLAGGARFTTEAIGALGRASFGFDYFRGAALDFGSEFATSAEDSGATLAGRVDMLRGSRAILSELSIYDAALPVDRARVGVGSARELVFGVSLRGSSPRGSELDAGVAYGPVLEIGRAIALGSRTTASFAFESHALRAPEGDVTASALEGELATSLSLGAVHAGAWARERSYLSGERASHAVGVDGELRARLALPLGRRFGELVHRVEPLLEAALEGGGRRVQGEPQVLFSARRRERVTVLAGLETAAGVGRDAADFRAAAGLSGDPDAPEGVLAARARAGFRHLGFEADARAVPATRAGELAVRARAGSAESFRIAAHVEGRRANPAAAERLFYDDFARPELPWLSGSGLSGGGSLALPRWLGVDTELGVELDLTRERFIGGSAALGYRHVCDCLGIGLWGGKRVGREGVDLAVRVDLVP